MLGLSQLNDLGDRSGQALPIGSFLFQLFTPGLGQRIELGATVVFAGSPFRGDPAFLFQFVQRWVKRTITDLKDVAGNLTQALADGPTVEGFESEDLEEQKVQGALQQVGRFAHVFLSVTESEYTYSSR